VCTRSKQSEVRGATLCTPPPRLKNLSALHGHAHMRAPMFDINNALCTSLSALRIHGPLARGAPHALRQSSALQSMHCTCTQECCSACTAAGNALCFWCALTSLLLTELTPASPPAALLATSPLSVLPSSISSC